MRTVVSLPFAPLAGSRAGFAICCRMGGRHGHGTLGPTRRRRTRHRIGRCASRVGTTIASARVVPTWAWP
jgi:hypothetical protein